MKKLTAWPHARRIRCSHTGMGRPYSLGDLYEIEPADLSRDGYGDIVVNCPDCGQKHWLGRNVAFAEQERARELGETGLLAAQQQWRAEARAVE